MQLLFLSLAWLPDASWAIPIIGATVCFLAYFIGRRFLAAQSAARNPDPEGLHDARFLQGVTRERRALTRRKGNSVEVELTDDSDQPPIRAWVLDRSFGGLCVLADQAIAQGTKLRVRPRNAAAATPWTDVTICSCREDDGQYELGCQFHHTPNYSLLLMFG
jgi:hypothetical protein